MKLLTANLTGKALDWALAVALGKQYNCHPTVQDEIVWMPTKSIVFGTTNTEINGNNHVPFSHDYSHMCLMLIKEHRVFISQYQEYIEATIWYAVDDSDDPDFQSKSGFGDTVEQAVARCVVAMHLGDEVEVPDELCGVQS